MPQYVPNTFQAQTPIGQALQNIASAMFQARMIESNRAMQERELAMKGHQFEAEYELKRQQLEAQSKAWEANALRDQAAAAKDNTEAARMQSAPDTIAQAMTQLTMPQLSQVRGYQKTGEWGREPYRMDTMPGEDSIAGLFNLADKPAFFTPAVRNKLTQADTVSAMSGNADQMVKGMQGLSDMQFIESNPGAEMAQTRGRATAATGGKALFSNPTSDGLIGDLFTGAILNTDNPMAKAEMGKDKAYSANQYAHARQADSAVSLNQAKTDNERAGKGGKDKRMTDAQVMERDRKNNQILAARKKLKAMVDSGTGRLSELMKARDPGIAKMAALAQERYVGVDDPDQENWIGYLAGQGFKTGAGYTPAGKAKPAAQGGGSGIPKAAMDFYEKNRAVPGIREQFIEKYGVDPEGA